MDHLPAPLINKKTPPSVIAKSVRYSWANDQKPLSIRIGYLVVMNATSIVIRIGIAANLVSKPKRISVPQIISKHPVNDAQNSGFAKPIFAKRPAPSIAGNKNFWIPSDKKTEPTITLIRMVVADLSVLIIF